MQTHRCSIASLISECALLVGDPARAFAASDIVRDAGDLLLPGARTRGLLTRVRALRGLGRDDEAASEAAAAKARLVRFADGLAAADRTAFLAMPAARATLEIS
jgi:hypothetical protein